MSVTDPETIELIVRYFEKAPVGGGWSVGAAAEQDYGKGGSVQPPNIRRSIQVRLWRRACCETVYAGKGKRQNAQCRVNRLP
jgi:hypothetical protein